MQLTSSMDLVLLLRFCAQVPPMTWELLTSRRHSKLLTRRWRNKLAWPGMEPTRDLCLSLPLHGPRWNWWSEAMQQRLYQQPMSPLPVRFFFQFCYSEKQVRKVIHSTPTATRSSRTCLCPLTFGNSKEEESTSTSTGRSSNRPLLTVRMQPLPWREDFHHVQGIEGIEQTDGYYAEV